MAQELLELYVPPEEFLRLLIICDAWLPDIERGTKVHGLAMDVPSMIIRKGISQVKVVIYGFANMLPTERTSYIHRLDAVRKSTTVAAKQVH